MHWIYQKILKVLEINWLCFETSGIAVDKLKTIVHIYHYKSFFISVKEQLLNVTHDQVRGVVGGSVKITWTITKRYQNDKVADTRLYLGTVFTKSNLLYQGVAKLSKLNPAKAIFGHRLQAIFKEPKYVLTINNLSYNDTIMFTLVVNQEIGTTLIPRSVSKKSVQIIVTGMHFHWKRPELRICFQ